MAPTAHVLIVEDDIKIAQLLRDYLVHEGYGARVIEDGQVALDSFRAEPADAIVLDLMLPGLDGLSVCRAVRAFSDVPILMLTARVEEADRLMGLDNGADDYVCKPFSPREVVARLKALLRRSQGRLKQDAAVSPWSVDEAAQAIAWRGQDLNVTPLEFRLLRLLMSQPGRVFSRAQLLDQLHLDLRDVSDRAIDSHIKNVRKKIQQKSPGLECITAVYGQGYRFEKGCC